MMFRHLFALALLISMPVSAVEFPFEVPGKNNESQYPCTLVIQSNQPSANQSDLGMQEDFPDESANYVRYPATCKEGHWVDLQIDCARQRLSLGGMIGATIFLNDQGIFTTNQFGSELSIQGKNYEAYLHASIFKPIYSAICLNEDG